MKLKEYIVDSGLKNTYFAKQLGVSDAYLYRVFNGRKPSKPVMKLIKIITKGMVTEKDFDDAKTDEKTA